MALVLLLLALVGATFRLLIWPPSDDPQHASAVVVLSGQWQARLLEGIRLVENDVAGVLVFVGDVDSPRAERLCSGQPQAFEVVCLHPQPDNTRTEARAVASLAKDRGWRDLVVVTSTHHVTRAGVLFRRCHPGTGTVQVVGTDLARGGPGLTTGALVREWLGLAHAMTIGTGC